MKSETAMCAEVASSCALLHLRKASRAVTRLYDEALSPSRLKGTQFGLLAAVTFVGEASMTQLAEALAMDRTTLTRNLKPLVRAGLITTGREKDQRLRVVTVTERGRRRIREAYPLWEEAQSTVVKGLGPKAWENLRTGLTATLSLAQGAKAYRGRVHMHASPSDGRRKKDGIPRGDETS